MMGGDGEEEEIDVGGDEGDERGEEDDEGEVSKEGSSGNDGEGHTRPFILPKIWTVNDFMLTMTAKVFKDLQDCYQIPDHILIRLPRKFEKCYSRKTADVSMYDATFAVRLRLPLTSLHSSVHPLITDKQVAFIYRVLEIPFDERRFKDLITLDTLHAYCGGPEPTPAARRLNAYSRRRNFQDQYKEALRTLNKEVKELTEKVKEEGAKREKEQQAKEAVEKELTVLLGQVETAMVDAVTEFKASQLFINRHQSSLPSSTSPSQLLPPSPATSSPADSSSLSSQVVGRSGFFGSGLARSIDVKPIDQAQKGLTAVRGCRGQQRRIEA
ncbi:hypothetical protein SO802_028735 [Lithocarpus litseifolius]|uniref:Uncharacterized protein n=1 Tax=Lithocarpus litseifolius TaxID=425828 RepID=A0AAW2BT37_9ROSI